MKKTVLSLALIFIFVFSAVCATPITIFINGKEVTFDQEPLNESGRVLVPMRAVFETMGAEIEWDGDTKTVYATKDDITITLTINSTTAYINDEAITLDVPAKIVNSRTLVPLRFVSESLECNVMWDGDTRKVNITPRSGYNEIYAKNGNLIYKGNFSNSKYDGLGTSYYESGDILYEGSFKNGMFDGEGLLYWENGALYYEGKFKDGKANSNWATLYDKDGVKKYTGQFVNGVCSGFGNLYDKKGKVVYEGGWSSYEEEFTALDAWLKSQIDGIEKSIAVEVNLAYSMALAIGQSPAEAKATAEAIKQEQIASRTKDIEKEYNKKLSVIEMKYDIEYINLDN